MKDDARWTPTLLLVTVLALLLGRGGDVAQKESSEAPREPAKTQSKTERTASASSRSSANLAPDLDDLLDEATSLAHGGTIDTLVATVADPIDAHVGWFFDMQVDAIERGAEKIGFLLDRYYLPWESELAAKAGSETTEESEGADAGSDAKSSGSEDTATPKLARLHRRIPGVILFRRKGGGAPLLVVLVGETPTGGVHREPFQRAECIVAAASHAGYEDLSACFASGSAYADVAKKLAPCIADIRVLGPTFSGTAASLRERIERSSLTRAHWRIVTGSASAVAASDFPTQVTFEATTAPTAVIRAQLSKFLQEDLGVSAADIALVDESTTAYGQTTTAEEPSDYRIHIAFPLHIAQARTSYEDGGGRSDTKSAAALLQPRSITLNLKETLTPRDVVPPLTPEITAADTELVIRDILSAIAGENVRYVLVAATDPRDLLFLSEELSERAPDIRLAVLTEAFLLYAHPTVREQLEGSIVASSYPASLVSQMRGCSSNKPCDLTPFASNVAEGDYNALLVLLNDDADLLDYGAPGKAAGGEPGVPPVWISVVAHDGLLPVAVRSLAEPPSFLHHASSPRVEPSAPFEATGVVLWIGLALSLLFIGDQVRLWVDANRRQKRTWTRAGGRVGVFQALWDAAVPVDRWFWAVVCCGLPLFVLPSLFAAALVLPRLSDTSLETRFFLIRSLDLQSGRSLALLIALLVAQSYVLGFCHLRRLSLLGCALTNPLTDRSRAAENPLRNRVERFRHLVTLTRIERRAGFALLGAILLLARICWPLTFDARYVDAALEIWLLLATTAVVGTAALGLASWLRLRPSLVLIARHPILSTIDDLAKSGEFPDPRRSLYLRPPAIGTLEAALARWKKLSEANLDGLPPDLATRILTKRRDVERWLQDDRNLHQPGTARAWGSRTDQACRQLAAELAPALFEDAPATHARWRKAATELVALEVAAWIGCASTHVWTLLAGATIGAFLLAFALTSFPMQPEGKLTFAALTIVASTVLASVVVLVQMERDPVLSRMSRTEEHRIQRDWTFARAILLYAVLPAASLIVGRVPQLSRLFDSSLRALR